MAAIKKLGIIAGVILSVWACIIIPVKAFQWSATIDQRLKDLKDTVVEFRAETREDIQNLNQRIDNRLDHATASAIHSK